MTERSFLCADCGAMGGASQLGYFDPPDNDFHADDKSAEAILKKNRMLYAGCPACRSANVFFSKDYTMTVFIPPTHASLVPDGGINVPAHTIPQPVRSKVKVKHEVVSSTPALGGGRNVTSKVTVEPDEEDEDVGDLVSGQAVEEAKDEDDDILSQAQDATSGRSVAEDLAKLVGGKVVKKELAKKVSATDEDVEKVDMTKIDPTKTGVGKMREHVPRNRFKRECKRCDDVFETKHPHVFYCRKCLRGFTK